MQTRTLARWYFPFPNHQPLFHKVLATSGINVSLAWHWTTLSAAVDAGEMSVRTSYNRLASLADGTRKTVTARVRRLEDADLAVVDRKRSYTSFRLRLRIGPDGPFYEGGKNYRRTDHAFFRAPHFLMTDYPELTPAARVLYCWSCSLPRASQDEPPRRLYRVRKELGMSAYRAKKAVRLLQEHGLFRITGRDGCMVVYSPELGVGINPDFHIDKTLADTPVAVG